MSKKHYFDIEDHEGYSIVLVGEKRYEFRIEDDDLLFEIISSLLGTLLITEKVFPVIGGSNVKMMDYYVSNSHGLVQLFNDGKITRRALLRLIKTYVKSARKSKIQIPAKMVSSIESDFKKFEPKERIRIIAQTILNMEQYKIVMDACNIPLSIAENARLKGLKNYLEHEKN